jgi:hypothetical protein
MEKKGKGKSLFQRFVYNDPNDSGATDEDGADAKSSPKISRVSMPSSNHALNSDSSGTDESALARLARATGKPLTSKPTTAPARVATADNSSSAPVAAVVAPATCDPEFVSALRGDARAALSKRADQGHLEAFDQLLTQLEALQEALPDVNDADRMRAALRAVEKTTSVNVKQLLGVVQQYMDVLTEKAAEFNQMISDGQRESVDSLKQEVANMQAEIEQLSQVVAEKHAAIGEHNKAIASEELRVTEASSKFAAAQQHLQDELQTIQSVLKSQTRK